MTPRQRKPPAFIRATATAARDWLLSWHLNWLTYHRTLRRHGLPDLPEVRACLRAASRQGLSLGTAHTTRELRELRDQAAEATYSHQRTQAVTTAIPLVLPWARHLTQAELAEFAAELTAALPEHSGTGTLTEADHIIAGWHATARIKAHPGLHAQATAPTQGDHGPVTTPATPRRGTRAPPTT